jgi:hypothetical protein
MASRHPPSFAPALSSSPSSSTQSSPDQTDLPPLSLPWVCHVEWFDLHGNSLGFSPGPLPELASTSQSAVARPSCPPPYAPSPPPSPASVPSMEDGNVHSKELYVEVSHNQERLQQDCVSSPGLRDSISILQDLVFAVWRDVDDLRFRLEHLDRRASRLNLCSRLSSIPCILQTRASTPPHLQGWFLFQNSRGRMSSVWLEKHRWSWMSTTPCMAHEQWKPRACTPTRHHDSRQAYRCMHACFLLTICQ